MHQYVNLKFITTFQVVIILLTQTTISHKNQDKFLDDEYGVKYPNKCEACKFLTIELQDRFEKLGKTSQVIETGYQIDGPKKRVKYTRSELHFIDATESVCDEILKYNIHKERTDSNRFGKGMSSTFQTLHQLVDKGVKVDLGIPLDLWDSPPAEVTALKSQCEDYLEKYHDMIESWYWSERHNPLQNYLCRERILEKDQQSCLDDPPPPKIIEYEPKVKTSEEAAKTVRKEEL